MARLSRDKGRRFELEIARRLRACGIDAERTLSESRDGGGNDLVCAELAVQCKVGQAPNPWRALEEAVEAAAGKVPIAILRRNRAPGRPRVDVAVLRLEDLLNLLELAHRRGTVEALRELGGDNQEDDDADS